MTNLDPLQPELLEKMWAVYYHKYQGRQKKKTYISNATELIKLMDTAITEGGINEMAYQQEPDSILWCVRNDGTLLGFTYARAE